MEEILNFCENLLKSADHQQKLTYSSKLLNDIPKLQTFLDKYFLQQNNNMSNRKLLILLEYAIQYLGISFILYLNCSEFCDLMALRFKTMTELENKWLNVIFESMFEKFFSYETLETNLDLIPSLSSLYLNLYGNTLEIFIKNKLNNNKNSQNNFEKNYNVARTNLKKAKSQIESKNYKKEYNNIYNSLQKINLNIKISEYASEKLLIKELTDEKEMLRNILELHFLEEDQNQKSKDDEEEEEESKHKEVYEVHPSEKHEQGYEEYEVGYKEYCDYEPDEQYESYETELPSEQYKNEEYKANEEFDRPHNKVENKGKLKEIEYYTHFTYPSHVIFLEDKEREYKNYYFPLNEDCNRTLRRTIIAFLNTNGGRIYIGIRDYDQFVFGIELIGNGRDKIVCQIDDLLKDITPKVESDECITKFVPLKSIDDGKYIPGYYIVKIIIKRGKPNELYFTKAGRLPFERRNGKNQLIESAEMTKIIIERSQKNSPSDIQANIEYNKKFLDPEPEIGIPMYIKPMNKFNNSPENYYFKEKDNVQNYLKETLLIKNISNHLKKSNELKQISNNTSEIEIKGNKKYNQKSKLLSYVIYIGVSNVTSPNFENEFLEILKKNLKEVFGEKPKKFIVNYEQFQLFIETQNEKSAQFLFNIIENITSDTEKYSGWKFHLGWAIPDYYYKAITSEKFNEIN